MLHKTANLNEHNIVELVFRRRKTFRYAESSGSEDGAKHKCRWYKVPYPVTTTCRCACQ